MEIIGAKLHKRQKEIFDSISLSEAKYHIINASRQAGKSYLLAEAVRYFAFLKKGTKIAYITPTYSLGQDFFDNIVDSLEGIPVIVSKNKSKLTITFINSSKLVFKSAEKYDNIRGGSYDYVFIDEFSFFKDEAWAAIKPLTAAKPLAKVIIVSTPRGKNLFYNMAMLGQSDNIRYEYYFMHYSDNPYYDLEEVIDAKKVLPDDIYRQEYEAEFVDDGGTVFKDISAHQIINNWIEPTPKEFYFGGLDIGKKDSTVLTILNKKGEVVLIFAINDKKYNIIIDAILPILEAYHPLVYVETNGVGDVFFDMLVLRYKRLVAWFNTNNEKTDIIEKLMVDIDDSRIKLPTKELCKALDFEMKVFTYEYSPKTRKIKYYAQPPHHDDHVLSLAIANKCKSENSSLGVYQQYKLPNKYNY